VMISLKAKKSLFPLWERVGVGVRVEKNCILATYAFLTHYPLPPGRKKGFFTNKSRVKERYALCAYDSFEAGEERADDRRDICSEE